VVKGSRYALTVGCEKNGAGLLRSATPEGWQALDRWAVLGLLLVTAMTNR